MHRGENGLCLYKPASEVQRARFFQRLHAASRVRVSVACPHSHTHVAKHRTRKKKHACVRAIKRCITHMWT
jgi:hypothetical protein